MTNIPAKCYSQRILFGLDPRWSFSVGKETGYRWNGAAEPDLDRQGDHHHDDFHSAHGVWDLAHGLYPRELHLT